MWRFPKYKIGQPIDWDWMEKEFSWFQDMKGVKQDPIWHAEGDVYVHTKMVAEALINMDEFKGLDEQSQHILFAAAMLHDVEKRSTTTTGFVDGRKRIVSPSHAKKGENTARSLLYKMENAPSFKIREQIAKLVRLHGLPLWAIEKEDPRKAVINSSLYVNNNMLSMLARADILGRICDDQEEILLKIDLFDELCKENDCFYGPREFKSNYGRHLFLTKDEMSPDYDPYNDLEFKVVMMSALPASGKDHFIEKNIDLPMLSIDNIRRANKLSPTNKRDNGRAIQIAKEEAKEFLRAKKPFVFNATNITSDMRGKWIDLFKTYRARVEIVYLEVPYEKLKEQNKNRKYPVKEVAIDKMIMKFSPPSFKEAHDISFVV